MLNGRRPTYPVGRRESLRLLVGLMPMLGCSQPSLRDDPAELRNDRVHGLVGFGQGTASEMLFVLRDGRRLDWSSAPVIRVPAPGNAALSVRGLVDSAQRPVLVVVRAHPAMRPYATVSLLEVGRGEAARAEPTDTTVRRCLGDSSWIAAFFIAGLGPVPREAVTLSYVQANSTYRLHVDPRVHTVDAAPALQLTRRDLEGDAPPPEMRVMSFQPSRTIMPVIPLVARLEQRGWRGTGSSARGGNVGLIMGQFASEGPPLEWRFYMLEAPSSCRKEEG